MAIPRLDVAAKTDPGLVRSENQDTLGPSVEHMDPVLLERKGRLYIVADGMGGHAGGSQASQIAVRTVVDRYYNDANTNLAQSLKSALKAADLAILREAGQNPRLHDMGTTLTAALVHYNPTAQRLDLTIAHVGDTRAYLLRGDDITLLTRDHTVVQDMVERRTLTAEQARVHPDRHKLSQALSSGDRLRIDVTEDPIPLQPGDKVLLSSDGLHDVLETDVIRREILGAPSLSDGIDRLISLTKERGAPDNITALIVSVPRGGRMLAGATGGRGSGAVLPLVGAGVALAMVAGLALFINRGVTEPQRRLAEARGTATALAVEAGRMVAVVMPTAPGNVEISGGGPAPAQIDYPATLTSVAASGATAEARVHALETEVAATDVPPVTVIPTRRPTAVASRSPKPPAGAMITLGSVESLQNGMVKLKWSYQGSLPDGAVFDVRVCKGDCNPESENGKTNETSTSWTWCPDAEPGTYHWQVLLVRQGNNNKVEAKSAVSSFPWAGGCGPDATKPEKKSRDQYCKDHPLDPSCQ